ncbi:MAG TPA: response regulator transcription factor [Gammaproteobacteria bacterium]|nr:response regulator transcription factor [Gammaproteobacteria bacterium]
MSKITVGIIEDSEIHRAWIEAELIGENSFKIVSMDSSGRNGIESAKNYSPDVIILDFQLQDMTGLEVARRIKIHNESAKIFMLTAHTEISILERIIGDKNINAIAVKGSPYLDENLLSAIKYIAEDGTYLDPSLLRKLRDSGKLTGLAALTKREFEIFIQVHAGKSDANIAQDLCVEMSHVKNIKSKISKKTQKDDIASLLSSLAANAYPDRVEEKNHERT